MADVNTQQVVMAPLQNDNTVDDNKDTLPLTAIPSTSPVHQLETIDTLEDTRDPPAQDLKRSFPQMFVFPHIFRKHAWALLIVTTLIVAVYIWLYLGSLWNPLTRVKNFDLVFYNADAGFDYSHTSPQLIPLFQSITSNSSLGSIVQNQVMDPNGQLNHVVTWRDMSQEAGWDRDSLIDIVEKGDAWGLVYIPSNFSNNFLSYAPSVNGPATATTVNPVSMEYVFDQGRAYGSHSILEKYISKSFAALCSGFEQKLLTSPANQTLLQNMYPSFWLQSMHFTETILHPVTLYGQNFAAYVLFIVMYIGSMLTVYTTTKFLPTTVETIGVLDNIQGNGKSITPGKFPALRIVWARHNVGAIFSTVHVIFIWMVPQVLDGHQMSDKYNAGIAFAFLWLVGKCFLATLFLLCTLLTVDGFQLPGTVFMILMFTSSGGILDWNLMPGFFRIGKAFPFTYAVKGMKAIYFGSNTNDMWINWVVITAWTVIPLVITMIMARSDIRLRREAMRQTSRRPSLSAE
ncbi:hypothetical protein BGZ76_005929 [Entomortierella beljakovae]|nr:hypothetical protein BGZ76_005929 [Entomortierella beljakovae]